MSQTIAQRKWLSEVCATAKPAAHWRNPHWHDDDKNGYQYAHTHADGGAAFKQRQIARGLKPRDSK